MAKHFIVSFLIILLFIVCLEEEGKGSSNPNYMVLEFETVEGLRECIESGTIDEGPYEMYVEVECYPEIQLIKESWKIPILLNIDRKCDNAPFDKWFFSIYGRTIYREYDRPIGITYKGSIFGKNCIVDIFYDEGDSTDKIDLEHYYYYADNYRHYGEVYFVQRKTMQTVDGEKEIIKGIDSWVGRFIMFRYDKYCVRIFTFANDLTDEEIAQLEIGHVGLPTFPKVYSSREEFHVYDSEDRRQIDKIEEKYAEAFSRTGTATSYILSYYEYYEMTDTKLPVVLSMSAEEAEARYGEEWLEVVPDSDFGADKNVDNWCYGILTAQQISDLLLEELSIYAYVASDDTVSAKTVRNIDVEQVANNCSVEGISSNEQLKIYVIRKEGDVIACEEEGKCKVTTSMHSAMKLY